MSQDLVLCLPRELRNEHTTLERVGAGLSGAGVYRVDSLGRQFILKVLNADGDLGKWQLAVKTQQAAAELGLAPPIVHCDEVHRAIVSQFVSDRSLPAFYGNPATRDAAIGLLGRSIRRLHSLAVDSDVPLADPLGLLKRIATSLDDYRLPDFVNRQISRLLTLQQPAAVHELVLSHNDVNPSNLVYDGERIVLLDWDTVALNDRYFDLATISVFLRMDRPECAKLLLAYGEALEGLPPRFEYDQELVRTLCGAAFLNLARSSGHSEATGRETPDTSKSLAEFYQSMRSGAERIDSAAGQWAFGLALLKAAVEMTRK